MSNQSNDPINKILEQLAMECWRDGSNEAETTELQYWIKEAHQAISKLLQEQDEKSHLIGFKNGKDATLKKVDPYIDPEFRELFEQLVDGDK